ncbi:hypothetical protein ABID81_002962 [Frigoribacterium sp. PvP054]|uniref:hypothetical protein n=1 Tax=Frigoribacterium sp. PvP054 TaxID=3156438 RepID=UPI00339495A5
MSTLITSAETTTATTSYQWRRTANASPSDLLINGAVLGSNVVPDPETTAVTYWAAPGGTREVVAGKLRVTPSGTATSYVYPVPQGADSTNPSGGRFVCQPGQRWTHRVEVTNPGTATMYVRLGTAFYNDQGNQAGATSQLGPTTAVAAGSTVTFENSGIVPPDATTPVTGLLPLVYVYGTTGGGLAPASMIWESTRWQVEIGSNAPTSAPFRYFTGATLGDVVSIPLSTRPLLSAGYQSSRQSRTVVHEVLGRSYPDITQFPMSLRSGTLTLVYDNEADALESERMHVGGYVMTYADSDLQSATMTYIVNGALTRELEPQTRAVWLVTVAYQEVTL